MSKVLLINGSSNDYGCTYTALKEVADVLEKEGVEAEIISLGKNAIRDCIGCKACGKLGKCVFDDDMVNEVRQKAKEADGFVFGTPVYYAHPSGRIQAFLDRLFYSGSADLAYKPAFAVASARRAGTTASLDVLNKYFTINWMPVVSGQYWNMVHGNTPDEVRQDLEGLQNMRDLARNLAWLIRCIKAGEAAGFTHPQPEEVRQRTNFIR